MQPKLTVILTPGLCIKHQQSSSHRGFKMNPTNNSKPSFE